MAAQDDTQPISHRAVLKSNTEPDFSSIVTRVLVAGSDSPVNEIRNWIRGQGNLKSLISSLLEGVDELVSHRLEVDTIQPLERLFSMLEHIVCAHVLLPTCGTDAPGTVTRTRCKTIIENAIADEPQRVCSRAFKAGDIVWNCKQCQKDSTCVLCQECFTDSNHVGHDVYFYHVMSDAGGCCDCGDDGAWDAAGFCTSHGGYLEDSSSDPRDSLSSDYRQVVTEMIRQIVDFLAKLSKLEHPHLILYCDASHKMFKEESHRVLDYFTEHSTSSRPREFRDFGAPPAFLKDWIVSLEKNPENTPCLFVLWQVSGENLDSSKLVESIFSSYQSIHAEIENESSITGSRVLKEMTDWLLKTFCFASDAVTRITCHAFTDEISSLEPHSFHPLSNMIVNDFHMADASSKSLRNLYIRLLVDSLFKHRFAIAFAQQYVKCAITRVLYPPMLEISDKDTVFSLSVQFLNRPSHVELLVKEHGFLQSIFVSLTQSLDTCVYGGGVMDLTHPVLTHRKTKCIVTDLTYVLNTPGMSEYILTKHYDVHMSKWLDVLGMVYNIHTQSRICAPHPPERDERWVAAFNLSLSLLSLYLDICNALVVNFSSLTSTSELLSFCAKRTILLLRSKTREGSIVTKSSSWGSYVIVEHDVLNSPVTFHVPTQRFFGYLYICCLASTGPFASGSVGFWVSLMRQSLSALVLFAQCQAGLWKRNEDCACQAMNYQSLPFVSGMFMDIRVLQSAAFNLDPNMFILYLIHAFGLHQLLKIEYDASALPQADDECSTLLAESMVELLCWVATELPGIPPVAHDNDEQSIVTLKRALRREIIHFIAIKRRTLSMVNDHCAHLKGILGVQLTTIHVKGILVECAQEICRTDGMGPIQYELKPECWIEFDPLFHRLMRNERDQARERWGTLRIAQDAKEASFPGDIKSRGCIHWKEPMGATCWYDDSHSVFSPIRRGILTSATCFNLVHVMISRYCDDGEHTAAFVATALHLVTLQVYQIEEMGDKEEEQLYQDCLQDHLYEWNPEKSKVVLLSRATLIGFFLVLGHRKKSIVGYLVSMWHNNVRCDDTNRESIRWILSRLCQMSSECYTICAQFQKPKKSSSQVEKEKLSRKRKAQRQALLNMKLSQEKALLAFADIDDDQQMVHEEGLKEDDSNPKKSKRGGSLCHLNEVEETSSESIAEACKQWMAPECVSCHEQFTIEKGCTLLMGFRQKSSALHKHSHSAWAVKITDEDGKNDVIQLCSHAIHDKCLAQYRNTIGSSSSHSSFLCPFCKSISNYQLPCVPPMLGVIMSASSPSEDNEIPSYSKWFNEEEAISESQGTLLFEQRLMLASKVLDPITEELSKMSGGFNIQEPSTRFASSSSDARRRESETMIFRSTSQFESLRRFFQNPNHHLICHSIGYTLVSERVADVNVVSSQTLGRLRQLVDAARGYLWVNNGQEHKEFSEYLTSLVNGSSDESVLRQSPAILLVLFSLLALSRQSLVASIRSIFILKLVQAVLDYRPDDHWCDKLPISPGVITWCESISFALQKHSWHDPRALENMEHINAHMASYLSEYAQTAQIVLALFDGNIHQDLSLVSGEALLLGMVDEFPTIDSVAGDPGVLHMVTAWIDHQAAYKLWKPRCSLVELNVEGRPLTLRLLFALNNSYTEQYVGAHKGNCEVCHENAHDRAICLICGEVLVAGKSHPTGGVVEDKGMCTRHTEMYHNGIGMVLLFRRSSSVLLIHNDQAAYWGSLYVDQNGEDQHTAPSLPMFLDPVRWSKLNKLWSSNGIPSQVSYLRNIANGVIRRNYY